MLKKRAVVLLVLVALLFLMNPPMSFAGDRSVAMDDEGTGGLQTLAIFIYAAVVVGVVLIIWGLYEISSFSGNAGDMVFNLHGFSTSSIGGNNLSTPPISSDAINYDIDWLLTDRREGRIWVASGITLKFPDTFSGYSVDYAGIGGNIKMGYRSDLWDYNIYFSSFTADDQKAMAWITYRY